MLRECKRKKSPGKILGAVGAGWGACSMGNRLKSNALAKPKLTGMEMQLTTAA